MQKFPNTSEYTYHFALHGEHQHKNQWKPDLGYLKTIFLGNIICLEGERSGPDTNLLPGLIKLHIRD